MTWRPTCRIGLLVWIVSSKMVVLYDCSRNAGGRSLTSLMWMITVVSDSLTPSCPTKLNSYYMENTKHANKNENIKDKSAKISLLKQNIKIMTQHEKQKDRHSVTLRTLLGRFLSSSSVIWVSYVGLSKTGGLSLTSLTWITTVV